MYKLESLSQIDAEPEEKGSKPEERSPQEVWEQRSDGKILGDIVAIAQGIKSMLEKMVEPGDEDFVNNQFFLAKREETIGLLAKTFAVKNDVGENLFKHLSTQVGQYFALPPGLRDITDKTSFAKAINEQIQSIDSFIAEMALKLNQKAPE